MSARVCVWSNDQLMTVMSIPSKPERGKLTSPWLQALTISNRGQGAKVRVRESAERNMNGRHGNSQVSHRTNGDSSSR